MIAHLSILAAAVAFVAAETTVFAENQPPGYQVSARDLTVKLSPKGEIVGVVWSGREVAVAGRTNPANCTQVGEARATRESSNGQVEFTRVLKHAASGRILTVLDRFKPAGESVRWEIEIASEGAPWTTDIATELNYPAMTTTRFWTSWSDPAHQNGDWRDPRVLQPFSNTQWAYSNLDFMSPQHGDFISLPLATVAEPDQDRGLSLILSPEDSILDLRLATKDSGTIGFVRRNHRLGGGKTVRLAMNLVAHEADWRGGLRWMVARYPQFFNPPNPMADGMAGCGAYSGEESLPDVAKLKKMAFRINWKLSDDFAWMGMFLPPLTNPDDGWKRACDEPAPPGKPETTSFRRMNDYARSMKENGFHVLNYFNVTELGRKMNDQTVPASRNADPDLWKDANAFIQLRLPKAHLKPHKGTFYGAWVADCGDPDYQQFLLEQARRHLAMLPDTAGICIDRMDWLKCYNPNADDGLSWIQDKPARSLCESWKGLMARLGPMMHDANKVIFVNPMTLRIDLMREADGFYSEHGEAGPGLNSIAMIALRKPAITWTCMWWDKPVDELKPDPDSFFQRHLLMGVYPTAPYPFNNHALRPSPATDRHYLDYGPLMDAMRGKKWVLAPHCVGVAGGTAKANLFEVPGGYALPVIGGGKAEWAEVVVRNVPGLDALKGSAIHPGVEDTVPVAATLKDGALALRVPLHRGCAMVRLQK